MLIFYCRYGQPSESNSNEKQPGPLLAAHTTTVKPLGSTAKVTKPNKSAAAQSRSTANAKETTKGSDTTADYDEVDSEDESSTVSRPAFRIAIRQFSQKSSLLRAPVVNSKFCKLLYVYCSWLTSKGEHLSRSDALEARRNYWLQFT